LGFLLDRSPFDHRPGHMVGSTTIYGFHLDGTYGHETVARMLPA